MSITRGEHRDSRVLRRSRPASTSAHEAVFRPSLEIDGQRTRFLVDQVRGIDVDYIVGDPVHYLERDELAEVEHAVTRYLGLSPTPAPP